MLSVGNFLSEDEDEYIQNDLNVRRKILRQESNIFSMTDSQFVIYFRLSKDAFKYVLGQITPDLRNRVKSTSVPNTLKLAATIRILAEGSYQKGAGNDFNVSLSQSSVSNVFRECIEVLHNKLCPNWISFPTTEEEKYEIKEHFLNNTGFPGVIGCIDGKIVAPRMEERFKYLNRKGFYSLNVTVVCDHKLRIRYISSHHHGSVHDSLVWNTSDLKQHMKENFDNGERNTWILGDAGYPLEKFLITPFRSADEGSPECRFNKIHSKTRNIVERAIGVLKNRFRCILGARQLHYTPDICGKVTAVCAALHNICIHFKIEMPIVSANPYFMTDSNDVEMNDDLNALDIRSSIMLSLSN
ncbi:putative nuclease HARBI1 [Musca domestica]|uniref:Nuclease HARBI1 n=1 Tax=Musca domestica TaxID=7370 RepID=A0ABM3UL93_MUSDO|nr:putative nuclease HARBI1 [Musca domestica]